MCTCTISGSFKFMTDNCYINSISLSNGNLVGAIPVQLGQLTGLISLDLSKNSLTGNLPSNELASLTKLEILNINNNNLDGEISVTSFDKIQSLLSIDIGNNAFTGNINSFIGIWENMKQLNLNNNQFTGTLNGPFSDRIRILDISNNNIYGTISSDVATKLSNLPYLNELLLSGNSFSGVLPKDLLDKKFSNGFTYATDIMGATALECPLGYTGDASQGQCKACIENTYKDVIGDKPCMSCAADTTSNIGASNCQDSPIPASSRTSDQPAFRSTLGYVLGGLLVVALLYYMIGRIFEKPPIEYPENDSTSELERQLGLKHGALGPVRTPVRNDSQHSTTEQHFTQTPAKLASTTLNPVLSPVTPKTTTGDLHDL